MARKISNRIAAICLIIMLVAFGCSKSEQQPQTSGPEGQGGQVSQAPQAAADSAPAVSAPAGAAPSAPAGIVAEVDGTRLTEEKLEQDYKRVYALAKQNLPEEKFKEEAPRIKARLVNDFIAKSLLYNEMKRRNIRASQKEVDAEIAKIKANLQPGTTLDDNLRKAHMTLEQLRQDTAFGIQVGKMVKQSGGSKLKPSEKDIKAFYGKNKDKFKTPETAHARHILIAKAKTDDDKTKAEKKAKAEEVRKELLAGADFAQLAAKYSECPSKSSGGDLGTFPRGQMVKPFEEAVFSQKLKETGPVVETDFGYHIIQVLERKPAGVQPLDPDTKKMISGYLERENQIKAYRKLLDDLKNKAKIVVYKQY